MTAVEVYKHLNLNMTSRYLLFDLFPGLVQAGDSQELKVFAENGFKCFQSKSFYFRNEKPWNNLPRDMVDNICLCLQKRLSEHLKSQKRVL